MLETILKLGRKILPSAFFTFFQPIYHRLLAQLAAWVYGWPSEQLIVIGVTGTKGKSTTSYLISQILVKAGYKVGLSSGIVFKVADQEWLNDLKMTMPGRLRLQRLLRDMIRAGCQYAVIETTSEGIRQYRHLGINYDVAVFTNLYPEHLESHGGFENYKKAKGELFKHLTQKGRKQITNFNFPIKGRLGSDGQFVKKICVVNLDDAHSGFFGQFNADEKIGFTAKDQDMADKTAEQSNGQTKDSSFVKAESIELTASGAYFQVSRIKIRTHLLGLMNIYNALAALAATHALGVDLETARVALDQVKVIPGRFEFIDQGQLFKIVVDYAHDPESLRQLFAAIAASGLKPQAPGRLIHVFGGTGGGRDKSKRAAMGKISDEHAEVLILTNDDPYDEDPSAIIESIAAGVSHKTKIHKIVERQAAIAQALALAHKGDLVLITGKGSEQVIVLGDGHHPWDDRQVVKDILTSRLGG